MHGRLDMILSNINNSMKEVSLPNFNINANLCFTVCEVLREYIPDIKIYRNTHPRSLKKIRARLGSFEIKYGAYVSIIVLFIDVGCILKNSMWTMAIVQEGS
jgi:hypothetical protein